MGHSNATFEQARAAIAAGADRATHLFNRMPPLNHRSPGLIGAVLESEAVSAELICDGVLVSTPAGSTAYNLSAHGPILPINAPLLAMTPISPFRPRRWRGALLPNDAKVTIEVLEPDKRPVSAVADHTEFRDVVKVDVMEESGIDIFMMFDPGHTLAERILSEQFGY